MIDPNKGASDEVLERLKQESYERFRIQLINSIEKLLDDFHMTWDDLGKKLGWPGYLRGCDLKSYLDDIPLEDLNCIAHAFSTEPYVIFRPRMPWTQT
jgi:hypothetical protein